MVCGRALCIVRWSIFVVGCRLLLIVGGCLSCCGLRLFVVCRLLRLATCSSLFYRVLLFCCFRCALLSFVVVVACCMVFVLCCVLCCFIVPDVLCCLWFVVGCCLLLFVAGC